MKIELVEPFPEWWWPLAWDWLEPVRGVACDDYSPRTIDEFVEYQIRAKARVMGVCADERLSGVVTFEQASPVMAIMHVLFAPHFRGVMKTGVAARAACARLFETSRTLKILGLIPANNRLAIALGLRSGARLEGTLRSHTIRGGKPLDAVAVGITREEFASGTEFRRINRRVEQQHAIVEQFVEHTDVLVAADGPAIDAGQRAVGDVAGGGVGDDLAGGAGRRDHEREPDQLGVLDRGHADEPVPGVARVRAKRANRAGGAPDGTRKARGAGHQRSQRGGKPARAK